MHSDDLETLYSNSTQVIADLKRIYDVVAQETTDLTECLTYLQQTLVSYVQQCILPYCCESRKSNRLGWSHLFLKMSSQLYDVRESVLTKRAGTDSKVRDVLTALSKLQQWFSSCLLAINMEMGLGCGVQLSETVPTTHQMTVGAIAE